MVVMSNGSKESLKNIFLEVCEELQVKPADKETYFKNLQREIREYSNFDCFANIPCEIGTIPPPPKPCKIVHDIFKTTFPNNLLPLWRGNTTPP